MSYGVTKHQFLNFCTIIILVCEKCQCIGIFNDKPSCQFAWLMFKCHFFAFNALRYQKLKKKPNDYFKCVTRKRNDPLGASHYLVPEGLGFLNVLNYTKTKTYKYIRPINSALN
jgi:hypothetical protein